LTIPLPYHRIRHGDALDGTAGNGTTISGTVTCGGFTPAFAEGGD
jgi:hypothetical protein